MKVPSKFLGEGLATDTELVLLWDGLLLLGNSKDGFPRGVGLVSFGFFGTVPALLGNPLGASLFLSADDTGGVEDLRTSPVDSGLRFGPRAIISPAGIPRKSIKTELKSQDAKWRYAVLTE